MKAEIHKYICICYYIFMSINYMSFSARSCEWYIPAFLSISVHHFHACFKRSTECLKVNDKGVWVVED